MADSGARRRWLGVLVLVLAAWALVRGGPMSKSAEVSRVTPPSAPPASTTHAAPSAPASGESSPHAPPTGAYDPAAYAPQVRTHAARADIDPKLLMAVLYNESYKPHDPELERAWQRYKPDAAFGIANMHRAAFDETKRRHDFANRRWEELPGDRDLAIEAAAWHLHDLAAQLPAHRPGTYTKNELLALGYNTGSGNMLAFARGAHPGSQAQSYLDRLHANWAKAGKAISAQP
ncbi:lytic transglycosylase domain-containing protein [Streptomyces sp. NPDC097727]|uniref:lytic transglycosylase domain-containing protein n=1 Tax=Streptomyces sp. NPDC097727 TaxID=3366092 RepID=UPI0038160F50